MTSNTYKVPDQRPQLERLQAERNDRCSQYARVLSIKNKYKYAEYFAAFGVCILAVVGISLLFPAPTTSDFYRDLKHISILAAIAFISYVPIYRYDKIYKTQLQNFQKKNTHVYFRCPNTQCPSTAFKGGIDATCWQCGSCNQIHSSEPNTSERDLRFIGDECKNQTCKIKASHFYCPYCGDKILLDGTRPVTEPARVPGWVRPSQPPKQETPKSPLAGFSDKTYD